MNIAASATALSTLAQEAEAARQAITPEAKDENTRQLAALSEGVDPVHVAEHIRSMVAATMGHLSTGASTVTRNNAGQWQEWALGVADGVEHVVPAAA